MGKVLDQSLKAEDFERQLGHYAHFQTHSLGNNLRNERRIPLGII